MICVYAHDMQMISEIDNKSQQSIHRSEDQRCVSNTKYRKKTLKNSSTDTSFATIWGQDAVFIIARF